MSTSGRSSSVVSWSATAASRMPMVDCFAVNKCYLCPPTSLLPMSPAAQISSLTNPFNPIEEFKGEYRCIASDLRNANSGQSSGPLEINRPWDAYTDDHLGVMDHLRIDKFMVLGFCIGGPFIWNLLRRAPNRIVAAVLAQPSGFRKEMPDLFYDNNITGWAPELIKRRPDI